MGRLFLLPNIPQEQVQAVPQRKQRVPQQHLVLLSSTNNVQHDIALSLEDDDAGVVEDDVVAALGRLFDETLLEHLLLFGGRVGVLGRGGGVRGVVVFGEDAGAVGGGEDEDCVDLWRWGLVRRGKCVWGGAHVRR